SPCQGVSLQPAGDGLADGLVPRRCDAVPHSGRRPLRDDAGRLPLPVVDARGAERPRARHRARDLDAAVVSGEGDSAPILSVEAGGVTLGGRAVLSDVSFELEAGQFTGLIGSNGAGKTTLFRVILGLQAASTGTVMIGGRIRSRRGPLVGYVPQKFLLDPDM